MAVTKQFLADMGKAVRVSKGGLKQGCGDDTHLLWGSSGSGNNTFKYRSLVRFNHNWSDVKRVVKIEMAIQTAVSNPHFPIGSAAKVRVQRATSGWSEGTTGENVWTTGEYQWPNIDARSPMATLPMLPDGTPQDNAWVFIDITDAAKALVPKTVSFVDGTVGGGQGNYGFVLRNPATDEFSSQSLRGVAKAFNWPTGGPRPYLLVTYDPVNRPPAAPTLTGPATTNNTFGDQFTGVHSDPDLDPMMAREIVVYLKGGSVNQWPMPANLQTAGSDEAQSGIFSVPLSLAQGSLKLQTDYEWVARTQDPSGVWGAYSARRPLRITSSAPTVVASPMGSVASMTQVTLGGTYSDPEGNLMLLRRVQVHAGTGTDWSDPTTYLFDTGESKPTEDEISHGRVAVPYAGRALDPGTYGFRVQAQDSTGLWSAWSQSSFVLTTAYDPGTPGSIAQLTQIMRKAPVRVHLWGMGTKRGRGGEIGTVDDPMELGGSTFLNGGGEVYFTLPHLHPYVPSIEPHQVHYAVEQYHGDRYVEKFAGVITDFDADADEITFYGTDYLGLLQTAVDERYDPNKVELTYPAGSKYNSETIDKVIRDQLDYHRGLADSPVGFINMGVLSALVERVTIYSTYTEALPFITGLIDSHKAGTGREARFYVKPLANGTYEFTLTDNWGVDRPNIRLEYGGLINDFRVVAFGDFGTRVLGVGQKRGEVKVFRKSGTGGLSEATFGRTAKTRFYQDINDENDLQRRVNEAASQLSKIGKRIALALRVSALQPFDGWDVGDSIVVDIERGAVDTPGYGSGGYWTIYGVEWRYHKDGHDELTLTVLPKKTSGTLDPDLIPSRNPGVGLAWQVGYGVPATYGSLPGPTPPPPTLLAATTSDAPTVDAHSYQPPSDYTAQAKQWQDLNTGCVYELDDTVNDDGSLSPTFGQYTEVFCPADVVTDGGGGGGIDTSPPPFPVIKGTPTSALVNAEDGTPSTALSVIAGYATPPGGLTDLAEYILQSTRFGLDADPTKPDWTRATEWAVRSPDATGTLDATIVQPGVLAAQKYWLRVGAVDKSGNPTVFDATTAVVIYTTVGDTEGPGQPTGIVLTPGISVFGVHWDANLSSDYDYTEVQWWTGTANPVSTAVAGSTVVISGVTNEVPYNVRLRSVDRSGNTKHDTGVPGPDGQPTYVTVKVADPASAGLGWVTPTPPTVTPTVVGTTSSVAWDDATIGKIFTGKLNADWLVAGSLKVGGAPGQVAAITVVDSAGNTIGKWQSDTGIEITDPPRPGYPGNPGYKMVLDKASLTLWSNYGTAGAVPTVAITPRGINAAAITFGAQRGGHNLIQNSSFELGRFGVSAAGPPNNWDLTADFSATRLGSDTNLTPGNVITMTAVT